MQSSPANQSVLIIFLADLVTSSISRLTVAPLCLEVRTSTLSHAMLYYNRTEQNRTKLQQRWQLLLFCDRKPLVHNIIRSCPTYSGIESSVWTCKLVSASASASDAPFVSPTRYSLLKYRLSIAYFHFETHTYPFAISDRRVFGVGGHLCHSIRRIQRDDDIELANLWELAMINSTLAFQI